jgi:hypothetical protein
MKMMMKLFAIVALLAITASCVTTTAPTTALPDKYNLNELKEVKELKAPKASNWKQVDNYALIFRDYRNDFFLIVLEKPLETSIGNERIGIVEKGQYIYAGIDKFFIKTDKGRDYYIIQKIYKLNGPEQAKQIKERLSK